MAESTLPASAADDLQFDTVEPRDVSKAAAGPGRKCVGCGQPIVSTYFAVGDKVVCPGCCARINAPGAGNPLWSFCKAAVLGLGAGLLGAVIWFAIRRVAHMELGIVAVLVGFMVGKSVRYGSGGRGGVGYQVLAVVLTYCCIAANYMPDVVERALRDGREHRKLAAAQAGDHANADLTNGDAASGRAAGGDQARARKFEFGESVVATAVFLGLVFAFCLQVPFLDGAQNVIGLLIIGFALWEAWKFNRPRRLAITGPYQLGAGPVAT